MGIKRKKVFIIYNKEKFTKDIILDELKDEEFHHYFKFHSDLVMCEFKDYVKDADEVWTFGNVEDYIQYVYAVSYGKEIWEMD